MKVYLVWSDRLIAVDAVSEMKVYWIKEEAHRDAKQFGPEWFVDEKEITV